MVSYHILWYLSLGKSTCKCISEYLWRVLNTMHVQTKFWTSLSCVELCVDSILPFTTNLPSVIPDGTHVTVHGALQFIWKYRTKIRTISRGSPAPSDARMYTFKSITSDHFTVIGRIKLADGNFVYNKLKQTTVKHQGSPRIIAENRLSHKL